jgi:hypothetical protein
MDIWINQNLQASGASSTLLSAAVGWTLLTHVLYPSLGISLHEPKEIPCSSDTALMVSLQSALTESYTSAVTSSLLLMKDVQTASHFLPQIYRCAPISRWWNHSETCMQLMAFPWKAVLTISWDSASIFLNSAQNLMHAHYSILVDIKIMTQDCLLLIVSDWMANTRWGLADWGHAGICPDTFRKPLYNAI